MDKTTTDPRYGMVIDVNRCVGCQTCTIACKHWNDTQPGVQWRKVLDVETGKFPDVERLFLVVGCQHCAEPPCVPVCPTGATRQRADGLVTMNYDVCIGCASCAVACPYQARTIVHDHQWYYGVETVQEQMTRHREREGVAQKCTFCIDKIDEAREAGLTPGEDLDVTPACAASCISQAIRFGDFNDPESTVSKLTSEQPYFRINEALGTDPQIKYLYSTPAVPGRSVEASEFDEERQADPANPLVGKLQTFWDWRAAMNWCFGGLASGFALVAWLAYQFAGLPAQSLAFANVGAAALMGVGLFFVWLKIGRKFRAWRAIFRPQTSWMTRELYAAAIFFPCVLAGFAWQHPAAFALGGLSALAFLVSQAKILHMAKGIPAWRAPLIPLMIFATGLLEGLGLAALLAVFVKVRMGEAEATIAGALAAGGIGLIVFNALLWITYRGTAEARGLPPLARRAIGALNLPLQMAGHALPLALFALALATTTGASVYLSVAGLMAIVGGMFWKFGIIVRAGYQQGFSIAKLPQRGSGTKAAPRLPSGDESKAQAAE
ncbi:MAG: DmsC/YnfH family molybdoenzyme membrane anchor subunit [Alphaproteobacteria bacterium]